MFKANQLQYRMDFYGMTQAYSDAGDPVESFTLIAARFAGITPKSSADSTVADGIQTNITHEIVARYSDALLATQQIVWSTRVFRVVGRPLNDGENQIFLVFNVTEIEGT